MSKVIYKYHLNVEDTQRIDLPMYSRVLCVKLQNGSPQLWALVDTTMPTESVCIKIFGTGNPIFCSTRQLEYIESFMMYDGGLVFHVFLDR